MAPTTRNSTVASEGTVDEVAEACGRSDVAAPVAIIEKTPVMKGFKVTDNLRSRKFGIGANSLQMLKTKAKLKFPIQDLRIYLASDGLEVIDEDYFATLESQTLLIVDGPDAIVMTESDYEFEQTRIRSPLLRIADIICEFMEKQPDKFNKIIIDYEDKKRAPVSDTNRTAVSLRDEDSEWFFGQDERCHTKEEALQRRAQDRVRCYYYKTKEELTRTHLYRQNAKARKVIDAVLEKFRYLLIGCDYFSMIFNRKCDRKHDFIKEKLEAEDDELDARSAGPNKKLKQVIKEYTARHQILDEWSVSLCTNLGDFYCQGSFSDPSNNCALHHTINPYASRENLILFQVWNLDHQVELSRSIVPSILRNVEELVTNPKCLCEMHQKPAVDISVLEYFLEIFSLKNLKLVHIVCHEKTQRTNSSNGRLLCKECHEYKIVEELMQLEYDYNPEDW